MRKIVLTSAYPFYRVEDDRLIQGLRDDVDRLREKVVAVQKEKVIALHQAEELRGEKDRLRVRADALKKELRDQNRITEQLQEKTSTLQQELAQERARSTSRRK